MTDIDAMATRFAELYMTKLEERGQCIVAKADIERLEAEAQALRKEVAALRARVVVVPDEREAFIEWMATTLPELFDHADAAAKWRNQHVSALAWQARARLNGNSISAETLRRIDLVLAAIRSHDFHGIINSTIGENWRQEVDAMRRELRGVIFEGKES